MRTPECNRQRMILVFVVAVFFAGCSSFSRKTPDSERYAAVVAAQAVISTLSNQNITLKNFKGLGTIKVRQKGQLKIDERIAWIGSETVRLSIVVLISGHAAVRMATDGKWLYYYEARQGQPFYRKIRATDASLKPLIAIPIKTSDIINFLAGRVPLREHDLALLNRQDSGIGYVLALKRRWGGVTEKILLDENKSQVHQIEFYNRSGSLIYRVRFDEMQTVKGYQVPARLSISNDEGADFQLVVDRYWADVDVSPSMFVLNPPE